MSCFMARRTPSCLVAFVFLISRLLLKIDFSGRNEASADVCCTNYVSVKQMISYWHGKIALLKTCHLENSSKLFTLKSTTFIFELFTCSQFWFLLSSFSAGDWSSTFLLTHVLSLFCCKPRFLILFDLGSTPLNRNSLWVFRIAFLRNSFSLVSSLLINILFL